MPVPTPSAVAACIASSFEPKSPPERIVHTLVRYSMALEPSCSEEDAYEAVGSRLLQYRSALAAAARAALDAGHFPRYELVGDSIVGYAFERPDDLEPMGRLRRVAPLHPEMVGALEALTPARFERFCSRLMVLFGAARSEVSGGAGDGGVDFIAVVPFSSTIGVDQFRKFESAFELWVVGQAKAYPGRQVGPEVIRAVIGACFIFRGGRGRANTGPKLCDPVVPLVVTNGRFSRGAHRTAHESGVVLKDVLQLATFLCVEGVGILEQDGVLHFSEDAFNEWLDS